MNDERVVFQTENGRRIAKYHKNFAMVGTLDADVPQGEVSEEQLKEWLEEVFAADDRVAIRDNGPEMSFHLG